MIKEKLYEIQKLLIEEMPLEGTTERKVLDKIDELLEELK